MSGVDRQPRIVHRELRRGDRVLDEDVHLLDVFLLDELQRVEAPDLARDLGRELRRVELRDGLDAAPAGQQRRPVRRSVPIPSDDTRPMPVTTTRRLLTMLLWAP